MRALFWLLALFALAVGVSLAAGHNEGYVLLVLPPWRAEVSLNFFIVLLLCTLVVAYAALRAGGTMPAVLNAANEVAVAGFLAGEIAFPRIAELIEDVLGEVATGTAERLADVLAADRLARTLGEVWIHRHNAGTARAAIAGGARNNA